MKKFFIYLSLTLLIITPKFAISGITSVSEPSEQQYIDPQQRAEDIKKLFEELPDPNNTEALNKYIQKRLKIASKADISLQELNSPATTSIVDTKELQEKQQKTLSAYEKIYAQTMEKVNQQGTLNENLELDGTFYRIKEQQPQEIPQFVPDFPYITIKLSDKKEILAPAEEHIAYMLTSIKIEPTGLMRVTEEFTFVSNNEGFPEGFFRILPKYTYSRNNAKRRIDLSLEKVTINNQEYPYKVTEIGNYLYIEPKKPITLPTGVYTYRFSYLIDRVIWFYDNFDEFYWDITAHTLKNVIGSTNALVILPKGKTFMAQNAIASTTAGLNTKRVTINTLAENSLGFADTEALGVGEDIHLNITLDKETIIQPDLTQKYIWLIQDHGAVIIALLALLAIYISFKISAQQIRRNQDKTKAQLKKTPAIYRLINRNIFDARSLGGEILNLCAKNILELCPKEETAVLIKKTDNLQKLSKTEQKLVKLLFSGDETTLSATREAHLKLKRAYKYLQFSINKSFTLYKLRLNGLYLLFSISMLTFGIIGASTISVNPWHTFAVVSICALLLFPFIIVLTTHFSKKYLNIAIKIGSFMMLLYTSALMAIYTSNLYALIILLSVGLIISYYRTFSRRNGLLRNKIKETEDYKSYLQKNIELAQTSRDFSAKIPYIFSLELEHKYKDVKAFQLIDCFLKQIYSK